MDKRGTIKMFGKSLDVSRAHFVQLLLINVKVKVLASSW